MTTSHRTAAKALLDTLVAFGVDRAFGVPGESYLAVLDAFHDRTDIDFVVCRHEGGAGLMAAGDARLTARPGVVFVTRGPGATNAAIAVHVAEQEGVPLILFVGQVERGGLGRGAFQEIDYGRMFGGIAKWVVEVHDGARVPELVATACARACSGTPGPVVVSLPEDMLADPCTAPAPRFVPPRLVAPAADDLAPVARAIERAERPVLLAGASLRTDRGRRALQALSERAALPVAATNKNQDVFPNRHPNWFAHFGYVNPPPLRKALTRCDLVVALGTRLGDVSSQGYSFPRAPVPDQPLVHVHDDPTVLGRTFETELALAADPASVAEALAGQDIGGRAAREAWLGELRGVRDALAQWSPQETGSGVDFGHAVRAAAGRLDDDAIVTMDAGNFTTWVHRFLKLTPPQRLIGAIGGAMGLGVPAAVAAALRFPERQVVSFVGDGGLLMTGNELATAAMRGANLTIIVSNNASYGTIRMHQELAYPNRPVATALANPDLAAWARSFGAEGISAESPEAVDDAIARAMAHRGCAVVDVRTDVEAIAANTTLASLRRVN